MKINGSNYDYILKSVESLFNAKGDCHQHYKNNGLSFRRYCFDVFYASKVKIGDGVGVSGDITIKGCNDNHILTAMKRIITKDIGIEVW